MRKLGILLSLILILSGCSSTTHEVVDYTPTELESYNVDMSVYPNMPVIGHAFKKVTMAEANRIYAEDGTAVLFYGYTSCGFCTKAVTVLNDAAMEMGVEIYYIDVSQTDDTAYNELISHVKEHLTQDDTGEYLFYVPLVYVVVDGEVVGEHLSLTDDYSGGSLTDAQYDTLKEAYQSIFEKLN